MSAYECLHIDNERLEDRIPYKALQEGKAVSGIVGFSILAEKKGGYSGNGRVVQRSHLVFEPVKQREGGKEERKAPKRVAEQGKK